jgi:tetrahydrodipicolinate N-succinyltransferase
LAAAENKSSTEYFVVLDTKTKACTVADKKPKTKTLRIVDDATCRAQAEAESGMKTIKVCIGK